MRSAPQFVLGACFFFGVGCAGSIDDSGTQGPEREYIGLGYFSRVLFEGSVTIHTDTPCALAGPYDVDETDNLSFAPTYPVDLSVSWTIGDQVYDATLPTVALERSTVPLPSGTHNAFFNLGKLDTSVDDPDDPGLAQKPFTISCDGSPIDTGFYLDVIVTEEENTEDGVTAADVREYIEAEIAYRRSAGHAQQYLEPMGYETFAVCEPCLVRDVDSP